MGRLSDSIGRKPCLLMALFLSCLSAAGFIGLVQGFISGFWYTLLSPFTSIIAFFGIALS